MKRKGWRLRASVAIFAIFALASAAWQEGHLRAAEPETAKIGATFVQLLNSHGTWRPEAWSTLFGQFKTLGVADIIVQWTLFDDTAFFPTTDFKAVNNPPLETILQLADENQMRVFVGLAHDSTFWLQLKRDPVLIEVYLRRLRIRSVKVAESLAPMVRRHPSFLGWYIPEEIDDRSFRPPEMHSLLVNHLQGLTHSLRTVSPGCETAISGFSSAQSDPRAFEEFWSGMLRGNGN